MGSNLTVERLIYWQKNCLFLTVVLFPIQKLLVFQNSLLSLLSFSGQISSIPLFVGLVLAVITLVKEGKGKTILFPVALAGVGYLLLCMGISLHSIFEYASFGTFDVETFGGGTPKMQLAKSILVSLGFESDAVLYGSLIFIRETKAALFECVFAFGFVLWVAYLYKKEEKTIFELVRKAVLWSVAFLTPYVFIEVLHLYGTGWATGVLKAVNSVLYEPCQFLGWYPPLVSPNQVRGTWTEPAFFALWLSFATPFIVSYFFEKVFPKKPLLTLAFFLLFWAVWSMTYARTSVVLALVLIGLYGFFTIYFHKRGDWITFGVLVSTLLVSFTVVSLWGPADIHKRIQAPKAMVATKSLAPKVSNDVKKQDVRKKDVAKKPTKPRATPNIERDLAQSHLFKNAVKSSFDSKSRSNPTRIQDFIMKLEGFKLHPILGSGDTLGLVTQKRLMEKNYSKLTREMRQRLSYTEKKGLFQSGIGGNGLYIPGMLVSRGLLGFLAFFGPIFALGVALFRRVLKTGTSISNVSVCVFISAAGSFLGAFSQGLWYFYFWGAASLALGVVLECSDKNDHVGWLKFMPLTEKTETVGVLPILRKVIEKLPIKSRHEFT